MKTALITGISGQDGYFLTTLLLQKGYVVHGIVRRNSQASIGTLRYVDDTDRARVQIHWGDVTDHVFIERLFREHDFDEVYHLAAQSFVGLSFDNPKLTYDVNIGGTLNVVNAVKEFRPKAKMYFAATSEMFGKVHETPQTEETPFHPRSPYGISKLAGFWTMKNYREAYNLFFVNGILFNHESEHRGEEFVTKKVSKAVARISKGSDEVLMVGNLDAKRDWGYAGEYVEGMWRMMQQTEPDDYVLATGTTHSVREFIESAFRCVNMPITWSGNNLEEVAFTADGRVVVRIDPTFFRPSEVDVLIGDPSKAERVLGWKARMRFDELVRVMVEHELATV
ncbi:MAG: GDP-mannose 4,6-dehydratase [Candidatus Uhrbacteria bacterium]|nr:GDP-mannose 4,6-dehydratase [Candidatus Uhrbacteria bacterium]